MRGGPRASPHEHSPNSVHPRWVLDERPVLVFLNRELDLPAVVHHDRAPPSDGLSERFPGAQEEPERAVHSLAVHPPMRSAMPGGISWWMIPFPAVIHWTSPERMTPAFPRLSSCSTMPSSMYVTVSMPRWGCQGKPATNSAGFSDRKSSRRRNGSRRGTRWLPKGRRGGAPAPSVVSRLRKGAPV